ncbi:hypothetical protein GCM10009037_01390 [Halarchaeum grantii]|uniref:PKD domain-containing protein n=1 Tax=Halarchaeum grantii TaxID=1193105 RepID=A0A830F8J8_9EURY|nr:S8 family serine peptidase [Halarchaeum grantii]GGL21766.1 hypothetical protein GCM10009037_01390 [Halarchaeum grantii]
MRRRSLAALAALAVVLVVASAAAPAAAHASLDAPVPDEAGTAPALDALGASDANTSTVTRTPSAASFEGTVTNVTLVTGQTVHAVTRNGTTRYYTDAATTTYTLRTPRGTYVVPAGVDFETFDPTLFNVDLLRAQGYDDANSTSIPVIVRDADGTGDARRSGEPSAASTDALDSVRGLETERRLGIIGAASTRVAKADAASVAERLRNDGDVAHVTLDVRYHAANAEADRIVDGERARADYGVSGAGVTVAVIDSGIDQTHPDLDEGKVVGEYDLVDGEAPAADETGHGTHVAATIAGSGEASNGTQAGIAPNASLVDVRVFGTGGAPTSRVVAGIEAAVNDSATDIVSMSLGGPAYMLRSNDPYTDAIEAATGEGIPVVVAAGNDGEYLSVQSPGVVADAITVGATDNDGSVASFSSRGPTPRGYYVKPDVVAPGSRVVSANAFYEDGLDYVEKSGTSMATPVTSGVVALVLSKNPALTPREVKSRLVSTADPLGDADAYVQGAGRVNATDALEAVGVNASDDPDPDIVVSPGSTDVGRYTSNTTANATLTVANYGESNATLAMNASLRNVVNPGEGDASVSLNRSTLALAPGERANVTATVRTGSVVGAYAGRVSFDASDATGVFGFARAYAVTVEKHGMGGTNVTDDPVLLYPERNGPFQRPHSVALFDRIGFSDGTVTRYLLTNGTYTALSAGVSESGGNPVITRRTVAIDGNTTVTLDEDDTYAQRVAVANTSTRGRYTRVAATEVETDGDGDAYAYSVSAATGTDGASTVYASNATDLSVEPTWFLGTNADASLDAAGVYYLQRTASGISGANTWTVRESDLARTNVTYARAEAGTTYDVAYRDAYGRTLEAGSLGDRRVQSVYRTAGAALGVVATGADSSWRVGPRALALPAYGTAAEQSVLRQPFTGTYTAWGADGTVTLVPQATQSAYSGVGTPYRDAANDTVRVRVNGSETRVNNTTGTPTLEVPTDDGTTVAIRVNARNDALAQSSRTVSTYEVTYEESADVVPPQLRQVDVERLDATSDAPNGSTVVSVSVVDNASLSAFTVAHANASATTTPFDGDASEWENATLLDATEAGDVHRYAVALNTTGDDGNVSLAVRAVDAGGNAMTSTTFDAFEVHDVPPEPRFALNESGPVEVGETLAYADTSWDNLGVANSTWRFGDGTTANGTVVTHAYDALGTYALTHSVTDTGGHTVSNETAIEVVDLAPTAALTATPSTPRVGESVTLSAADATDTQGIAEYRWDVDGDGTIERTTNASEATITHAYASAATAHPRVTVVDTRGQTASASTTVSVQARATTTTTSNDGGGGGGGGGGGFAGGGSAGTTTTTAPTTTTTTTRTETTASSNGTTVVVSAPVRNGTATVTLTDATSDGVGVTGATLSLTGNASRVTVTVARPTGSAPSGTPALDRSRAVRYFGVEADAGDAAVRSATLHFTVADRALPDGVAPADVTLYRYHGGTWDPLPTASRGGDAYAATTPGFSVFAVGGAPSEATPTPTAAPVETATSPSSTTVAAGETTSGGSPAPGVGAVLVAAAAALLLRRR